MQSQLPAVPCEELPLLLRYLLQNATSSNAPGVISALRSSLHFVEPSDPRLAVPDLRQKGPAHAAGRGLHVADHAALPMVYVLWSLCAYLVQLHVGLGHCRRRHVAG